jgi:hypothetical protein
MKSNRILLPRLGKRRWLTKTHRDLTLLVDQILSLSKFTRKTIPKTVSFTLTNLQLLPRVKEDFLKEHCVAEEILRIRRKSQS